MSEDLTHSLDKAKFALIKNPKFVFITNLLYSLKLEWTEKLSTAGVDGINLFINPNFWLNLTEPERVGLLWHEVWHIAYEHLHRGDNFLDHKRFNKAADYAINQNALGDCITLPKGALLNSKYDKMSTEQIYGYLPPTDENDDFESDLMPVDKATEEIIKGNIAKAAVEAKKSKSWSDLPGEVQVKLDKLLKPKLPWNALLHRYVNGFTNDDYTYTRPNRKYLPDLYLPSLYNEALKEIVVAVDTSGSVTDKQFAAMMTEIKNIQVQMQPEILRVLGFDTKVHTDVVIDAFTPVESLQFVGRGGTRLEDVYEKLEKSKPTVAIIFSDMYVKIPPKPKFPIIWLCVNNNKFTCKYGRIIHYEA